MIQDKQEIRKIVRQVIKEIENAMTGGGWDTNNDISHFHGYPSGYSNFPTGDEKMPENLPNKESLNSKKRFDNFQEFSKNKEIYDFPIEDFKVGLSLEKSLLEKSGVFKSYYDLARLVIDNLESNKFYYRKNEDIRSSQK
jgi:hypothetical protein